MSRDLSPNYIVLSHNGKSRKEIIVWLTKRRPKLLLTQSEVIVLWDEIQFSCFSSIDYALIVFIDLMKAFDCLKIEMWRNSIKLPAVYCVIITSTSNPTLSSHNRLIKSNNQDETYIEAPIDINYTQLNPTIDWRLKFNLHNASAWGYQQLITQHSSWLTREPCGEAIEFIDVHVIER